MQVLIIEDEKHAAQNLVNLLTQIEPQVKVMSIIGTVKDSVSWLNSNEPDLIFMDVTLSDGFSYEIFDHVDLNIPVIVTSSLGKRDVRLSELHAMYYLPKPIDKRELAKSINKFREMDGLSKGVKGNTTSLKGGGSSGSSSKKGFLSRISKKIRRKD